MRYAPLSGGWILGPLDGSAIEVIPAPGTPPLREGEMARVMTEPFVWAPLPKKMRRGSSVTGIAGHNSRAVIRFVYPRERDPLEVLYALEEEKADAVGGAALFGQVWGGLQGLRRKLPAEWASEAARMLALACEMTGGTGGEGRLNAREVEEWANRAIAYLLSLPTEDRPDLLPSRPMNRVRFWLAVSRRLWQPRVLEGLSKWSVTEEGRWTEVLALAHIAGLHLLFSHAREVGVRGRTIPVSLPGDSWVPWLQVLEWTAGDVPDAILRRMAGGGILTPWPNRLFAREETPVHLRARALAVADALLEEARVRGRFVPGGFFHVLLPSGVPLTRWGIVALRVWAFPQGLWVQTIDETGRGPVFGWKPDAPFRSFILSPFLTPFFHAAFAALWHDLRVAEEKAFPERRERTPARTRRAGGGHKRARVERLPRVEYPVSGHRAWGDEAALRAVRQAHRVREHVRRLPEGWRASEEAKRRARDFGYILPEGYTFVRPHARGGERGETTPTSEGEPVTAVARGLVTLVAMLGGDIGDEK